MTSSVALWLLPLLGGCGAQALDLVASTSAVGELRVSPEESQQIFSMGEGVFLPASLNFRLGNVGDRQFDYDLACDAAWLTLSRSSGRLQPGGRAEVILGIDSNACAGLVPGWHAAEVRFSNSTNGKGDTSRSVRLLMRSKAGLRVEPVQGIEFSAAAAGADPTASCRLGNDGDTPLEWEVLPSVAWVSVIPASGKLDPGGQVQLAIQQQERPESKGRVPSRSPTLTFYNRTDGVGTTLRRLNLDAVPIELGESADPLAQYEPAPAQSVNSITQYGITWTFTEEVQAGRYVTGDWWVVGPVLIASISPISRERSRRVRNGSMINPSPRRGLTQGYDSATYDVYKSAKSYVNKLNVAFNVDLMQPLVLQSGSSLVSTISNGEAGVRPQIKAAAILTCVASAPPVGAFRPPYSGAVKDEHFVESQLRTELLSELKGPPSTPDWGEVEAMFERPWIDHVPLWVGRYIHPTQNMENYGREICDAVSTASLMLHLDASLKKKRTLLLRFVQLGIDLHGVLRDGGSWRPEGGHMSGRKWPILFAGLMLNDAKMQSIGVEYGPATFAEDGQTYYVGDPRPKLGYLEEHRGLAEWGVTHARKPENDDVRWRYTAKLNEGMLEDEHRTHDLKYRLCCTANVWWGEILAARIMGARELWNHAPLFDYQDRYFQENKKRKIFDASMSLRAFYLHMWRRYRKNY